MSDDRFVSPAAPPRPSEVELIDIFIEECAEAIQRATKLLRFGPTEIQPGQLWTNSQRLGHEIGDVLEMVERLVRAGIVTPFSLELGVRQKKKNLAKYLQRQDGPCNTPNCQESHE